MVATLATGWWRFGPVGNEVVRICQPVSWRNLIAKSWDRGMLNSHGVCRSSRTGSDGSRRGTLGGCRFRVRTVMIGPRDWLQLDEHAEELRDRVAQWEHHAEPSASPLLAAPIDELAAPASDDFQELHALLNDWRQTEEELRQASR